MRYAVHHKQDTRARIVAAASRGFREHGLAGASVAGVMAELGLTHGGFYAHFRDKDALVAAACSQALASLWADIGRHTDRTPEAVVRAIARNYLTPAHRAGRADGCPIAALGAELARSSPAVRRAVARDVKARLAQLAPHMPGRTPQRRQDAATVLIATLVGTLLLSRLLPERDGHRSLAVTRRMVQLAARSKTVRARQERARS
jgi:TetR/AcrR family transcriptional regulator, transcriptional repressor for nem operon